MLHDLLRSPPALISALVLVFLVLAAVFAPLVATHPFDAQMLTAANLAPSADHWFGTDEFGRDVWSRVVWGTRTSLGVACVSIAISVTLGLLVGTVAGFFGGWVDRVLMMLTDLTWCFPEILLAFVVVAILGPGAGSSVLAIAIAYLAQFARLARTEIRGLKGQVFIEASRSLGAGPLHLMFRRLLPNALPTVAVSAMLALGAAILLEATLGFFGMGAQPPVPSWGSMMSAGSVQLFNGPWVIVFPGLFVAASVLAINIFGDVLLKRIDVRERKREGV